jgi:protein-arginine kinase
MYSGSKKLNKAQAKASEYVQKHKIEKLISEMVNSLVHTRDKKPVVYMIKYLANYCTQEELDDNGIKCQGPLPQRVPLMNYPDFTEECTHLLKAHLTKEIWSAMKKRATHLGGKIQLCVQCGVYDEKDDIGIYATDEEAYKVFEDIFSPIVQDLHPDYDIKTTFRNEFELISIKNLEKLPTIKDKVSFIKISARRNFKDYPFTPMMSTQIKFQVEKKVVETLGEVYGQYYQLAKIDDENKAWLESVGIDITRNKSHDSAGINEDWPSGRGVFIDENRDFVVLVNFEDHVQIYAISQNGEFQKNLLTLQKLLSKFEKMGYARHSTLGYLTASPKNLGTTLQLGCKMKLKTKYSSDDIESFENTYTCKIVKTSEAENEFEITFLKTLAKNLTENDAVHEFAECLLKLTENEVEIAPEPQEEEKAIDEVVKVESVISEAVVQEQPQSRGSGQDHEDKPVEAAAKEEKPIVSEQKDAPVELAKEPSPEPSKEPVKEEKVDPKNKPKEDPNGPDQESQTESEPKAEEAKIEVQTETETEAKVEAKAEVKEEAKVEAKTEVKEEVKTEVPVETKDDKPVETESKTAEDKPVESKPDEVKPTEEKPTEGEQSEEAKKD